MKKIEVFAVVDAGLGGTRVILKDVVENSVDDTDLHPTKDEALEQLRESAGVTRDPKDPYHKVIKITIEEVTTIEDAIADRASE